jgi:hypothetical protein
MEANEILAEIRATRDGLMRDCAGDLVSFFEMRRVGEAHWASAGHPIVSFVGLRPLELPPVDWERIDDISGKEIVAGHRAVTRSEVAQSFQGVFEKNEFSMVELTLLASFVCPN